ncbi:ABC transporter substrate-binding protein [Nocardia donostiensis]|uniref:Uncharacterized protein n=1 Tax=Nocardia donostiensis TaxID=1538463 RepID=A0A1W0BGW4_9NOCA|nr:ABC transporter substrate-binding protein [Nocardia donostiensis]ONM49246.1 hypothetical protein B0T46_07575 [Nocardia donostiensis]OQS14767.1 hypothetical protein B0T36_11835 [Nocardia donostiensis]OQS21770.1 hypothetical protein B0T44_06530 [Nocardia donostiensis]
MSDQIVPPAPSWRKWAWAAAAVAVAAVVALVALVAVPLAVEAAKRCGDGVIRSGPGSECVGVTDGSVMFEPELAAIQEHIHTENTQVAASGKPYVSIAVLLPMTRGADGGELVTMPWLRHHLEGAHLAQLAANHTTTWGGTPQIRLLLANAGSGFGQWATAVDELDQLRDQERIVAVAGIGLSVENAVRAMERLAELGLPIIGSTLTADSLTAVPGFLRISPPNSDQARAAAMYAKPRAQQALLVRDENPNDHYAITLAEEFSEYYLDETHRFSGPVERYNSQEGGVANTFNHMLPNICHAAPQLVYFAGRAVHAITFIKALAERSCRDIPITVLTGEDMSLHTAPDEAVRTALESGVSVVYTASAHPQSWENQQHDLFNLHSVAQFAPDCRGPVCYRALSDDSLDDASAIVAHDAVVTAVQAIRQSSVDGAVVSAADVLQSMNRLHGATAVRGAAGILSFDEAGDPVNKPIPMLRLLPGRSPEFLGLSWPGIE